MLAEAELFFHQEVYILQSHLSSTNYNIGDVHIMYILMQSSMIKTRPPLPTLPGEYLPGQLVRVCGRSQPSASAQGKVLGLRQLLRALCGRSRVPRRQFWRTTQ
jgi:hypothetical protein